MKDYSKEALESSRPMKSAYHCIGFCLKCLFEDSTHSTDDEVVTNLTFEELMGALLLAKDSLDES